MNTSSKKKNVASQHQGEVKKRENTVSESVANTPVYALILAGGRGARFGAEQNKCFVDLCGRSILRRSYEAFLQSDLVAGLAVVIAQGEEETAKRLLEPVIDRRFLGFVHGGRERQDSVRLGLAFFLEARVRPDRDTRLSPLVLVHDAARCLVTPPLIDACVELAITQHVAVAPAVKLSDTIRAVDLAGRIEARPDRERLRAMQTPQCARLDVLSFAYQTAERQSAVVTDDLSALELIGYPVRLIEGENSNIKITQPQDFDLAEIWLKRREK